MDPLIKSQLLYHLSYAPDPRRLTIRVTPSLSSTYSRGCGLSCFLPDW